MKKIFFVFCTIAALALVACNREDPAPDNNGGGNNGPNIPEGEGIYNPVGAHISTIEFSNGEGADQNWIWSDYKLQRIDEMDDAGNFLPAYTYSYNGWRLSQMLMMSDQMPGTVDYTYTNDKLTGISISTSGMTIGDATFVRDNADKVTHIDIVANQQMIEMLINILSENFFGEEDGDDEGSKDMLTTVFGNDLTRAMAVTAKALYGDRKLSVSSTDFAVDFTWNGENVSQVIISAAISGGITINELNEIVDLESVVDPNILGLLSALSGDQELPLDITVGDTIDYTYDQMNNPFKGFLGQPDVSCFSANNVASSHTYGTMKAALTVTVPFLGDQQIPFSQPIDDELTSFTYNYNAGNFPTMRESSNDVTVTYTYSE